MKTARPDLKSHDHALDLNIAFDFVQASLRKYKESLVDAKKVVNIAGTLTIICSNVHTVLGMKENGGHCLCRLWS